MTRKLVTITCLGASLWLTGCGAETAATAASGALAKKQELEHAQGVKQGLEQQLNQAQQQEQQRLDALKQATQ